MPFVLTVKEIHPDNRVTNSTEKFPNLDELTDAYPYLASLIHALFGANKHMQSVELTYCHMEHTAIVKFIKESE